MDASIWCCAEYIADMELQEIDVFIAPDGQVRLEVRGASGTQCLALTKELEASLGAQITNREMTPEANDSSAEQVQQDDRPGSG